MKYQHGYAIANTLFFTKYRHNHTICMQQECNYQATYTDILSVNNLLNSPSAFRGSVTSLTSGKNIASRTINVYHRVCVIVSQQCTLVF